MIEITAIRFGKAGGHRHTTAVGGEQANAEQITDVMWRTGTSQGQTSTQAIIDWLSGNKDNHAIVAVGPGRVQVLVVRPPNQQPHLRAQVDGAGTDCLLSLPRF